MPGLLSQRLFPLLQLTRLALVFTAISNSLCTLLLWTQRRTGAGEAVLEFVSWKLALTIAIISTGLYGFGMSLNDIIDRRRDRQLAADRPLPSGRVGLVAAHVICIGLALMAVAGGAAYTLRSGQAPMPLVLVIGTAMLITFYDYAGKYLPALGILTLGLIRFFHAVIPAPAVPLLWHPLLLLNHVTILSLVAYRWEQKRPRLTRIHVRAVLAGLAGIDLVILGLGYLGWRWYFPGATFVHALWIKPELILPLAAAAVFVVLAGVIRRRVRRLREAGKLLMLYGLLWLIIYDAAFAAGYVGLLPAGMLLVLLPVAYGSVNVMRGWGRLISLSQRPQFRRVEG
jgi:4-hydroxybenzoate polyprenyltransferase